MPQQVLQNNVLLQVQRESINSNFTELYDAMGNVLTKEEANLRFIKTINGVTPDIQGNVSLGIAVGGDLSFEFTQSSANNIWTITHNLGKYPSVTIVDSAGDEVEGMVNHTSFSSLIVTFSAAFSGKAYLN